ncbi:hypothetical protein KJ836_02680 [Patescibacteria group bacterium]|nr:hypothetical protein [Patescibacteria group bacterium]
MTDFFEDKTPESTEEAEVEKIKIGEEEFDPEELSGIIAKGRWANEVETKQNTKLDKLMPEYTKATQRLKDYEEKEKVWNEAQEKKLSETPQNELSEEELVRQTKLQAKKFGLITVDDIDQYVTQRINSVQQANELLEECKGMEKEYGGEDGRPKFETEEILKHMQETGIKSPLKAWKDKYEEQIDKWKEDQLGKAKKSGLYTETGSSGNHEPSPVKLTKSNLQDALTEALNTPRE